MDGRAEHSEADGDGAAGNPAGCPQVLAVTSPTPYQKAYTVVGHGGPKQANARHLWPCTVVTGVLIQQPRVSPVGDLHPTWMSPIYCRGASYSVLSQSSSFRCCRFGTISPQVSLQRHSASARAVILMPNMHKGRGATIAAQRSRSCPPQDQETRDDRPGETIDPTPPSRCPT